MRKRNGQRNTCKIHLHVYLTEKRHFDKLPVGGGDSYIVRGNINT